jgi:adenosine deaminase
MNKKDFYSLLSAVPKSEIHIHCEAVISRNTVKKLYKECNGKVMSASEMKSLFAYNDLAGFINSFLKIQSLFTKTQDFNLVFDDFAKYLEDNNIVYCETFFSPTTFLKKGFSFSEMMNAISTSIAKIKKEQHRTIRVLVDVSRTFGEENAQHNLDLILKENNPNIIGIGLGGDESKGPAKNFAHVFKNAKEAGLHVVAHAGEDVDSSSIKDAIKYLGVERIGHGITSVNDSKLIAELAKTKLPLEICPTSNTFTKKIVSRMEDHPVRELYDKGVFVTINTDDPTFFGASLIDEYYNLYTKLNFTLDEIEQLIFQGFAASFISDNQKKAYCSAAKKAWTDWMISHPESC